MGASRLESFAGAITVLEQTKTPAASIVRSVGRSRISVAVSLLIIAIAAIALYHLLRDIELDEVIVAIESQPRQRIATATVLVFAGYFNLIFYDLLALHIIDKRRMPLRVIAFTSFTSYTIGHSLGAATLTCGLVRFRVYSFWNLTIVDIAKIAFITGMTFWIGNIAVLGGAVAYAPQALSIIDHLPSWLNRLAGFACLAGIGCYLAWLALRPRMVGRANWKIVLPNTRLTMWQITIGILDRCLASLSFFMLLPNEPAVGFITVLVAFVIATLIGTISHTPGSLGVVEAGLLICLPQFQREALLATILIYRILDFFIPLLLATLIFALRELRLFARRDPSGPVRARPQRIL